MWTCKTRATRSSSVRWQGACLRWTPSSHLPSAATWTGSCARTRRSRLRRMWPWPHVPRLHPWYRMLTLYKHTGRHLLPCRPRRRRRYYLWYALVRCTLLSTLLGQQRCQTARCQSSHQLRRLRPCLCTQDPRRCPWTLQAGCGPRPQPPMQYLKGLRPLSTLRTSPGPQHPHLHLYLHPRWRQTTRRWRRSHSPGQQGRGRFRRLSAPCVRASRMTASSLSQPTAAAVMVAAAAADRVVTDHT